MTYKEFLTKLVQIYKFSKEIIDVYNTAFKDKINRDFTPYWEKYSKEYYSLKEPPMPSFWLREDKDNVSNRLPIDIDLWNGEYYDFNLSKAVAKAGDNPDWSKYNRETGTFDL